MGGRTRKIKAGRGHRYELDGDRADGVTTIISNGVPKPALVAWAAGTVGEFVADRLQLVDGHVIADDVLADLRKIGIERDRPIPPTGLPRVKIADGFKGLPYYERDLAGGRGTEVHALAHRLAQGEEVQVPEELTGHVDAYLKFRDEWQPAEELLERTVINRRHGYMGTFDLACYLEADPELGFCLIDLKTNRSGPFGEVGLQCAGYRYADTYLDDDGVEQPMPTIDSCLALWLRADGYDLYPIQAGEAELRVWLYAREVARFCERSRDIKGAALPVPTKQGVLA